MGGTYSMSANMRNAYIILVGNPKALASLRRSRRMLEVIGENLKIWGVSVWTRFDSIKVRSNFGLL